MESIKQDDVEQNFRDEDKLFDAVDKRFRERLKRECPEMADSFLPKDEALSAKIREKNLKYIQPSIEYLEPPLAEDKNVDLDNLWLKQPRRYHLNEYEKTHLLEEFHRPKSEVYEVLTDEEDIWRYGGLGTRSSRYYKEDGSLMSLSEKKAYDEAMSHKDKEK